MKKKIIKNEKRAPTLLKNYQKLLRLAVGKKEFLKDMSMIRDKWNLPRRETVDFIADSQSNSCLKKINVIRKERYKFLDSLVEVKKKEFIKDVLRFLDKYELGLEWFSHVTDMIISSFYMPPIFNLDFGVLSGRFCIILNPDTSLNDIKKAWRYIEEERREIYPNAPKIHFKTKLLSHLKDYLKDSLLSKEVKALNSDTLEYDAKKKTDLDRVGELFPDPGPEDMSSKVEDVKRANYLRQIRKRIRA